MIPERPLTLRLDAGIALEGALALPAGAHTGVVVCHPHPLYGGDMDSPVVVAAARACRRSGMAVLRFNFRGVGGSNGRWDEGRGEQDDVGAALAHLRGLLDRPARVALAGYSFGAAMAAAVAAAGAVAGLALIAPPLASGGWKRPAGLRVEGPVLLVAGSDDAYCPAASVAALRAELPAATVTVIDGADHFFYSGLAELESALAAWAATVHDAGRY
jgi:alpha/beta superfamily hydrolase